MSAVADHTGRLLVALPSLIDPNFDRTVVYLLDHGDGGAVGLVLNRPSDTEVTDVLPRWADALGDPAVVFAGGPCEPEVGIAVAPGGAHGVQTIDLDGDPMLAARPVRVFAGYAGWGPRQLDAEIAEGAWVVVDGGAGDVFSAEPRQLWPRVLRRQGGDLARLSLLPDDLSVN